MAIKENSIEEDIKMIEILKNKNLYINIKPKSSICIDCINKNKNKHIEAEVVINEKLEEAINYTLSAYKRVLKENEELKFKERSRIIGKYGDVEIHDVINRTLSNDYISVKKIKDKIENLKKVKERNIKRDFDTVYKDGYFTGGIDTLQELLESEE